MTFSNTTRREFLLSTTSIAASLSLGFPHISFAKTTQTKPEGFFTLGKKDDRWWLIGPDGKRFFTLGLNHVDPATIRYPENIDQWRNGYGNSMKRWLTESVAPNLKNWGFNTLGWNQEVITSKPLNHRHSRHFTREEYHWLNMPYCHQLPFADFHQWESETRNPDFFSEGFADWCDHVAREHCVPLADDPNLIGYFYIDCPCWLHVRKHNQWKGPLFDSQKLKTESGKAELRRLARQYYKVTHDAIRRYDQHHLILGDRYEANAPLTMEIIDSARPFVDVLSFQDFRDPVNHLHEWHRKSKMPVLWADGARGIKQDDGTIRNDGNWYAKTLSALRKNPGCIGAHLCGAYYRNRVRRRGLLDENEQPDIEMINAIRNANLLAEDWVKSFSE
ncbi:hypothetical protein [Gimesia aquarii]|uniref:Agarase n=1 Tax=Gimesia aquarii TaxID=2527964 RepID=A0A517W020_9PLAN|nr:hypothetical protein [Gimesia aquarii]QDT98598.1 hypothetical protein V144x_41050 [Gimesia aquarii]